MVSLAGADPKKLLEEIRQAKARKQFLDFVRYTKPDYTVDPVHQYVAAKLQAFVEAAERGESPRLILKMGPQHGKSELSSRRLPAFILGRNPKWNVALMCYSAEWAGSLGRDARDVVDSEEFAQLWPSVQLDQSSRAVDEWNLTRKAGGGGFKAVGRDGGITGRRANVLIVDDPIKNREEAYSDNTRKKIKQDFGPNFRTRMAAGGGILIVATQWHHDELIAHLSTLHERDPKADRYEVINLTAIAEEGDPLGRALGEPLSPSLHDLADLEAIKASLDSPLDWDALYMGRPTPEGGSIFQTRWITDNQEDAPDVGGFLLQAYDTAFSEKRTADYTAGVTIRAEKNCYRVLDVLKRRMEYPALKGTVVGNALAYEADAVLIEDIGSGKSLGQDLKNETLLPIVEWKPDKDKVTRANAITGLLASGKVKFPRNAPWMSDFLMELQQFPAGAHDDQVDALTMALTWLRSNQRLDETKLETHSFTYDSDQSESTGADFWNRVSEFRKAA